jgi:hypothetical protein
MFKRTGRAAVLGAALTMVVGVGASLAHESRDVGDYTFVVGFLDEPVYAGLKSGLDLRISAGDSPVEGAEETLEAQVIFGDQTRDLELSPAFGEPGAYRSVFFPTAAGSYTFRIFGEIEGTPIDESFTSGPDTFGDILDNAGGQFPVVYPATADLARDAEAGAGAATMATIALGLGAAGLLAGLVALGVTLGRRTS